jgi:hypothetical protein
VERCRDVDSGHPSFPYARNLGLGQQLHANKRGTSSLQHAGYLGGTDDSFFASRAGWHPANHFLGLPVIARWLFALLGISILATTVSASHSPIISALFALRYVLHMMLLSCLIFLISKDSGFDLKQ